MKKIIALITVAAVLLMMSACTKDAQRASINIAVLKGPTGISAACLMEENSTGGSKNKYSFTIAGAADEITAGLVSGSLDIAALPTNLASVIYNKTQGGVCLLAASTLGVLYVLERGNSINDVKDLQGKKIISSGQGTVAEYVVDYILEQKGIGAEITYGAEHSEAASLMASGSYDIAIVPEPFVTSILEKDSTVRIALDITEEWEKQGKGELVMGVVAARKDFVENNPNAVKTFLKEYENSVSYANTNTAQTAQLCEKYDIISSEIAQRAIPNCHMVFIDGEKMKETVSEFLNVMYSFNQSCVGGEIPAQDFYN